jgi:hypothetical protein
MGDSGGELIAKIEAFRRRSHKLHLAVAGVDLFVELDQADFAEQLQAGDRLFVSGRL